MWTIFKVFLLKLLQYFFRFMLFGHKLCGVLAPLSGVKSSHLVLEGEVLRTWPPGMSPGCHCLLFISFFIWRMASRARGLSSYGSWALLSRGTWHLSSLTRGQTLVSCIGRWSLNHCTTREVPLVFLEMEISKFVLFCYNRDRKLLQGVWYSLEK